MALMFVKRSAFPTAVKGKAGAIGVSVTKFGQVQLTKMAVDYVGNEVVLAFDGAKVYLFRADAKMVAKFDPKDRIKLTVSKKSGQGIFGAGQILNRATEYGASAVYPYKESGNQSFPVTKDEKNGCLIFELPATALTPKLVTPRKKKVVAPGVAAEPGKVNGVAVNHAAQPVVEEELIIA